MKLDTETTRHGWRLAGLIVALLLLLTLVLYQQTLFYLTGFWNQLETGEYAHGYLVLAISAYLILRSRQSLSVLTPRPNFWALLLVLAFGVLWMVAALVDVQIVQAVALLLLILAIVWATLGSQVVRTLMFPILFIIFAIPVWFPLSTVLQDLTADVVFEVVRMLKIPAFRQENMITLPAGTLSVEESCSGMRYFLAALTLGALYAYLYYQSFRARLIVIVIAAIAGVLANILRVFIIVYLGFVTDMQHSLIHDHLMLGWYLFGGLVVILLFIDARLYRWRQATFSSRNRVNVKDEPVYAPVTGGRPRFMAILISGALLLSLGPVTVYRISQQLSTINTNVELVLPVAAPGWTGPVESDDDWMPKYKGAIVKKQVYAKNGQEVFLYIGYYPVQTQGKELIAYHNQICDTEIWQTNYTRARNSTVGDKQVLEQLLENKQGRQRLVWYWYNVGGWITSNKYAAKALQVPGLLTGEAYSYVIAVAADEMNGIDGTKKIMREFILAMDVPLATLAANVQTSAGSQ